MCLCGAFVTKSIKESVEIVLPLSNPTDKSVLIYFSLTTLIIFKKY